MVRRIVEEGRPVAEVASGFGISERTARKRLARWGSEGAGGLENRSSRPRAGAAEASRFWSGAVERLRREYQLTGEEIAAKLGFARSTVAGWLTRAGLSRLAALEPKQPVRRYQRDHAGELVHFDIKIRHIRTHPYTPRTNGKAERFIKRCCVNGRMPTRSSRPIAALPICPDGSPGTTN